MVNLLDTHEIRAGTECSHECFAIHYSAGAFCFTMYVCWGAFKRNSIGPEHNTIDMYTCVNVCFGGAC